MTSHDYSQHVAAPTQAEFQKLNDACTRLANEESEIERLEQELKAAKLRQVDIAEREMPELMESMGLAEFTTTSGVKIKVKESVHAHISRANHARAMQWLDDNGHGAMIKRRIEIAFDRGSQESAASLMDTIVDMGLDAVENMKVESSTLRAWAREQLEIGASIDQDLFGIHVRKVAKID